MEEMSMATTSIKCTEMVFTDSKSYDSFIDSVFGKDPKPTNKNAKKTAKKVNDIKTLNIDGISYKV